MEDSNPVNSPTMPVDAGIVQTAKQFSDGLTMDLTDDEIARALQITLPIKNKWQAKIRSKLRHHNFNVEGAMKLVDQFEHELVTELAEKMDLMVTVDVAPVFEGEPMVIEFIGCLDSHTSAKYGMDHERKSYEVRKANEQGEAFLGVSKINE